jgi:hypothetical protein
MKKLLTLVALFSCLIASAQSPKTISYQAILRDNVGVLIANDNNVSVRVSLIQGPLIENNVIYVENHNASTNSNGLFTLEIGGGTIESGNYSNINWALGPYYLKTEIDPQGGTNYLITAVSELLSVPLANYAFESGRLPGKAGEYAGWYQQSPESINTIGILFEPGHFGLTYVSPTRLFFHIYDSNDGSYLSKLAEVNPGNPSEITIYFDPSLSFTATWNDGILTIDVDGVLVDFIKE